MKIQYSCILLILLLNNVLRGYGQDDTAKFIKYTVDFKFNDGIYLNFEKVKNNSPIAKERIVSNADYNSMDFFEKVTGVDKIVYYDNNTGKQTVETSSIWGYGRLGTLYIRYNDEFNRIPIIGSIAHFVADLTTSFDNRGYDPYSYQNPFGYDPYRGSTTTKELHEYMIDFTTGKILDFTSNNLKIILMRDTVLYDEFNNLSRRKQNKMIFMYLRKYNERNPLWLPKN
ncbi:MAG: hypothetical protein NTW49_03155 [Bacteroidia bacterium]|nr:hypothetical protein [Bacteroidia bacterium]